MNTYSSKYIEQQLKALGLKPISKNKNYFVVCPFHADSPGDGGSMAVMKNGKLVKCFSGVCGWRGSWEKFLKSTGGEYSEMQVASRDPHGRLEAQDTFRGLRGIKTEDDGIETDIFPADSVPWTLGEWRGISQKTLTKVGSRFWIDREDEKGRVYKRILWPIYYNGELEGWTSRTLKMNPPPDVLKHKHNPGFNSRKYMGFLDYAAKKKFGILVEGMADGLALRNVGLPGIPIFGTETWTEIKEAQLISLNLDRVIVGFDNDPAGKKCRERLHASVGQYVDLIDEIIPKKKWMEKRPDFGNVEEFYPGYLLDFKKRLIDAC